MNQQITGQQTTVRHGKGILAASIAASLGGVGAADAAVYTATLKQVVSYSANGSSAGNITSSTATWSYNDVTGLLSQTGGTFNVRFTIAPTTTLFRHSIEGLVIGNGAPAAAATYLCTEGNFGGSVGASICGNYNFGANQINESTATWGPGITFDRTLAGDDMALGTQQNVAAYDNFTLVSINPVPPGEVILTNGACTIANCGTIASGFNGGYRWTLDNLVEVQQGPVADTADAESGVATDIDVLANDVGYSDPVTVTITVQGANGTAVVNGSPGNQAAVDITYTSNPGYTGTDTFTYQATDGTLTDTGVVTVTVVDSVPESFSFASQAGVAFSTPVTSGAATITGISVPVAISVAGGEYSIGCTATFTNAAATVTDGQDVCVRHTSAAAPLTDTVTTLTVGGVNGTFTSTTVAVVPDTTPDPFNFVDQESVARNTEIVSAPVTITGINAAAPISVTGGEYSIGCNGTFTAAAGTITNGQTVCLRHTSAATAQTAVTTTLSVGPPNPPPPGAPTRVQDAFSSLTRPAGGGSSAVDGFVLGLLGLLGLAGRGRRRR